MSESERFADEETEYKSVCRKPNSPVGCSPGRAAKGETPTTGTTKNASNNCSKRFSYYNF